jgi:hypothetical protein
MLLLALGFLSLLAYLSVRAGPAAFKCTPATIWKEIKETTLRKHHKGLSALYFCVNSQRSLRDGRIPFQFVLIILLLRNPLCVLHQSN